METKTHSLLSPSGAHRWLACTPSARFEEQLSEQVSEYAAEGTTAHDLAALKVIDRLNALDTYGVSYDEEYARIQSTEYYNTDMETYTDTYVDHALSIPSVLYWIEQSFNFIPPDWGLAPQRGTVDLVRFNTDTIYITDFKYGTGVKVSAYENPQLLCYALGVYLKLSKDAHYKIENLVLEIYQPRTGDYPLSSWTITPDYLLDWAENELHRKAPLVFSGIGGFVPGDHCRFCKAKTICSAFFYKFRDAFNIKDRRKITPKQRAQVLKDGDVLIKWINAMKTEAINDLLSNRKVEGFKLVGRSGNRVYKDEALVIDALLSKFEYDQVFKVDLRTITDLEKQLGKKEVNRVLDGLLIKKEGGVSLVSEDDERQSYSAASDYD